MSRCAWRSWGPALVSAFRLSNALSRVASRCSSILTRASAEVPSCRTAPPFSFSISATRRSSAATCCRSEFSCCSGFWFAPCACADVPYQPRPADSVATPRTDGRNRPVLSRCRIHGGLSVASHCPLPCRTSSTRRLRARPSSVSLVSFGRDAPNPAGSRRPAPT
jgi:hypothetical protein